MPIAPKGIKTVAAASGPYALEDSASKPSIGTPAIVGRPLAVRHRHPDLAGKQSRFLSRLAGDDLKLDAPLGTRRLVEHAGRDQFGAGREIGGDSDRDHRRGADVQARGVNRATVRMLAKEDWVETWLGVAFRGISRVRSVSGGPEHPSQQWPAE